MAIWQPGMKAVCIRNSKVWVDRRTGRSKPNWGPKKGDVVTVESLRILPKGRIGLRLVEWQGQGSFGAKHFRPVIKHKTDISIFKEMLKDDYIPRKIKDPVS